MINIAAYSLFIKGDPTVGDSTLIFLIVVCNVLRSTSIAGKYATFSPKHILKIKKKKITEEEITAELMAGNWLLQNEQCIKDELGSAIERQQIDLPLLYLSFMAEPSPEILKEFEKIRNTVFKDCPLPLQKVKKFGCKEIKYFNGKVILAYLIQHYNKTDYKNLIFRSGLFIGLFYSSIPGLIRVYYGQKFHGEGVLTIIVHYLMYPTTTFLIMATNLFFTRHNIDMRRRRFVLQQLGMMISPL